MNTPVRIGTRDSKLAVWQAVTVQQALQQNGIGSELVFIKSDGDTNLVTPLYAMGVQGVFTKALDAALLSNEIDIAVHSMKDVPVQLAQGVVQAAVLQRGNTADIFVWNDLAYSETINQLVHNPPVINTALIAEGAHFKVEISQQAECNQQFTLATSSIRRKAQWLHYFPESTIEDIRGNINTRLQKVQDNKHWNGAIFAAAGLQRLELKPNHVTTLDWMLPAPSQGAIMVVCRTADAVLQQSLTALNDAATAICTKAERDFLKTLLGGCSTPISALATIENDAIHFKGNITKTDGSASITISFTADITSADTIGENAAKLLLEYGGSAFVDSFV
jgi:hydroxymethylbilane synthase